MLAAAAAVAVLAAGGIVIASRGGDEGGTEFSLEAAGPVPGASGSGRATQTESGWRIEIDATACRGSTTAASTRPG